MSGPLGSSQWFKPKAFYPHAINQSLRFEDGDNPYLSKTLSGSGSTIFTFSCWIKLGNLSTNRCLLQGYADGSNFAQIVLYSGNYVGMYSATSGTARLFAYTEALQRDPSAWYNIVVKFNGTSSSEEFKIYVNGVNQTLTTSTSLSAHQSNIGKNNAHYIGNNFNQSLDMDGYMAEVNFIDGTALDADSFGETKAGIWIPKDTSSLTFGTNGFRLKFQDSSALGNDTSGVSPANDFTTVNGLASTDVVPDSPTNNWCTINPLNSLIGTLSEGNLKAVTQVSGYGSQVATMGHTSGKCYWEVIPVSNVSGAPVIGVVDETYDALNSGSAVGFLIGNDGVDSIGYYSNGSSYVNGTANSSYGASYTGDDIIGIALNLDDNQITFYKNNSSQGAISHTFSGNNILPAVSDGTNSAAQTFAFNFGQDSSFAGTKTPQGNSDDNGKGNFYYSPPSGFLALCAANLSDPGIDPNEGEEPEDYFNTLLYTGDGNSNQTIGSTSPHILQFNPGFVWVKSRSSNTGHHSLGNRVIGDFFLNSNQPVDEYSFSAFNFNTNNTIDVPVSSNDYSMNTSSETYVAWNWLAGSSTPTKTYTVKVVSDSGNKYRFDDFATSAVTLDLQEGGTYTFDQSDSSMSSHPMKLSETANGSHGGGSTYNTGVTYQLDGSEVTESAFVSGFSSATSRKLIITVAASAPTLYYFCHYHSGMGGQVNTNSTFGSSNFSGSIQSTVSENTEAGFSIVSYTGTGTTSQQTIGVGLSWSGKDKLVITKNRDDETYNWGVNSNLLSANKVLSLNTTNKDDQENSSHYITYETFGFRTYNGLNILNLSNDYIAYCFHSVDGYSKVGSYTGNGDADGVFVYTGFRPAWLMVKNSGASHSWRLWDNKREPENLASKYLTPDSTSAEGSINIDVDLLSNGFKMRNTNGSINASGNSYIYLAFAEQPFKYSNAR